MRKPLKNSAGYDILKKNTDRGKIMNLVTIMNFVRGVEHVFAPVRRADRSEVPRRVFG